MDKVKVLKILFFASFAMCLAITLYFLFSAPGKNIGKGTLAIFAVPFSTAALTPRIMMRLRASPPKTCGVDHSA